MQSIVLVYPISSAVNQRAEHIGHGGVYDTGRRYEQVVVGWQQLLDALLHLLVAVHEHTVRTGRIHTLTTKLKIRAINISNSRLDSIGLKNKHYLYEENGQTL